MSAMVPIPWNPFRGCSPASRGCANCVNMRAGVAGLTTAGRSGAHVWNGTLKFDAAELRLPERTRPPSAFGVNSDGDLWHENAPAGWIDRVFGIMEREARHSFVVVTKRAARMRDYLRARYRDAPAPANVVFGVQVEGQRETDERLPALLASPVRWRTLTAFPMLERIELRAAPGVDLAALRTLAGIQAGGESLRPADPAWIAALEREARALGVPFTRASEQDIVSAGGGRAEDRSDRMFP